MCSLHFANDLFPPHLSPSKHSRHSELCLLLFVCHRLHQLQLFSIQLYIFHFLIFLCVSISITCCFCFKHKPDSLEEQCVTTLPNVNIAETIKREDELDQLPIM